jgi:hypothetical protein
MVSMVMLSLSAKIVVPTAAIRRSVPSTRFGP